MQSIFILLSIFVFAVVAFSAPTDNNRPNPGGNGGPPYDGPPNGAHVTGQPPNGGPPNGGPPNGAHVTGQPPNGGPPNGPQSFTGKPPNDEPRPQDVSPGPGHGGHPH